jgi:nucleolar complex protein 3
VNIDFFKDLMKVLKDLISREAEDIEEDGTAPTMPKDSRDIQYRLLCIVTAFELLSGQGEYIERVNATSFDAAYTRGGSQHRPE